MDQLMTNVLVMGRSGVGKSSFINYIYGEYKRETGTGRPVTERGLHKVVQQYDDIKVNLYDTWGLEANRAEEWKNIILDEVKSHNESFVIKDWFHTIFYCLSAQRARVEDFEINEIINPLIEQGNRMVIVLTHGDVIDVEKKSKGMIERLLGETEICSEDIILVANEVKKLLGGGLRRQFGKEKVLYRMKTNLWFDIREKLPKVYSNYINKQFDYWKSESYKIVEKRVKFLNRNSIIKKIIPEMNYNLKTCLDDIDKETDKYIQDSYEYYIRLVRYYYNSRVNANIDFDDILDKSRLYFKMDLTDKIAENIAVGIFTLIPFVNLFVPYAVKELAKDNIKEEIDKSYRKLANSIPNYVYEFENILDNYCKEFLLLESRV